MAQSTSGSPDLLRRVESELHKGIVGQEELIRGLLFGLLADGHLARAASSIGARCPDSFAKDWSEPDESIWW